MADWQIGRLYYIIFHIEQFFSNLCPNYSHLFIIFAASNLIMYGKEHYKHSI